MLNFLENFLKLLIYALQHKYCDKRSNGDPVMDWLISYNLLYPKKKKKRKKKNLWTYDNNQHGDIFDYW